MKNAFPIDRYLELEKTKGPFRFELSYVRYQVWDASYQFQPLLILHINDTPVAMARVDYYSDNYVNFHLKIFKKHLDTYKGQGLGSLMAMAMCIYSYRCEGGRVLMTSRSFSHDAINLFKGLAKKDLVTFPRCIEDGLNHLLGNKERAELGLPDKFEKYGESFFNNPELRFCFKVEKLPELKELEDFFWARFTRKNNITAAYVWFRKLLGLKYRPKL